MKTLKVLVKMSGYVEQDIEVDDNFIVNDDTIDEVLDEFDFSEASDIVDSIEWKLRYADSIEVIAEDEVLWRT